MNEKNEIIGRLEDKTSQINATMKQLEQRYSILFYFVFLPIHLFFLSLAREAVHSTTEATEWAQANCWPHGLPPPPMLLGSGLWHFNFNITESQTRNLDWLQTVVKHTCFITDGFKKLFWNCLYVRGEEIQWKLNEMLPKPSSLLNARRRGNKEICKSDYL